MAAVAQIKELFHLLTLSISASHRPPTAGILQTLKAMGFCLQDVWSQGKIKAVCLDLDGVVTDTSVSFHGLEDDL